MQDALQLRDNARHELEQIRDLESGVAYLNKVKTIETWAKAEKKDAELQNMIAEQKLRTQRILGRLLKDEDMKNHGKNQFNAGSLDGTRHSPSDYGLSKNESSAFQRIASLPDELFEHQIESAKQESEKRVELTTSRMLNAAKEYESQKKKEEANATDRDKFIIKELKAGRTTVVNQKTDLYAIKWAEEHDKFIRCDRFSEWGNHFELDKDGTRDEVIYNYKHHYIPFKPSLLSRIGSLKGRALGCWCSPLSCHCDVLKQIADDE
jgi:hypothetical protein